MSPARMPSAAARVRGMRAMRKFALSRVGLLRKISLRTMPIARAEATDGKRAISENCLRTWRTGKVWDKSLRMNWPMLQPRRAEVIPARIYR